MFFFVSIPLLVAIPLWIILASHSRSQQKKLARALYAQRLADAHLMKEVAQLPNSGVSAFDLAKAEQVLGYDKRYRDNTKKIGIFLFGVAVLVAVFGSHESKEKSSDPAHADVTASYTTPSPSPASTNWTQKDWDDVHTQLVEATSVSSSTPEASPIATPEVRRAELVATPSPAKHHHRQY
jgi:hypothetical protein